MTADQSDSTIFQKIQEGNKHAFRQFVERHQSYVYALSSRILCNREDAQDATQECFIRIWKHCKRFNGKSRITTWIYKIATNVCLDIMRANKRKRTLIVESTENIPEPEMFSNALQDNALEAGELTAIVEKIVRNLPMKQRLVFTLRDLQDLDIGEVAEVLEISVGNVKSLLCYARRAVRKKLGKILEQE